MVHMAEGSFRTCPGGLAGVSLHWRGEQFKNPISTGFASTVRPDAPSRCERFIAKRGFVPKEDQMQSTDTVTVVFAGHQASGTDALEAGVARRQEPVGTFQRPMTSADKYYSIPGRSNSSFNSDLAAGPSWRQAPLFPMPQQSTAVK